MLLTGKGRADQHPGHHCTTCGLGYQLNSAAHVCVLGSLLIMERCYVQAGGKQPDSRNPRKNGSPGLEVTEEQLVAGEEEGAASIVEVYAALLLGFVTESDLAQQKARLPFHHHPHIVAYHPSSVLFAVGA